MTDIDPSRNGSGRPEQPYRTRIDEPENATVAVAEAVATALNRSPVEIEPIVHDVDPTTLERLVVDESLSGQLQFRTNGVEVSVKDDGEVVVDPDV